MIEKKLVVANGSYTKDGAEKTRWVTIGALHEHDGKRYITLEAHINLAGFERKEGETRVFANLFNPEPYNNKFPEGAYAQKVPPAEGGKDFDDEIPF
jgi:hypothetical protein